jgi:cytochrome c-type biogenesis protein CcmE
MTKETRKISEKQIKFIAVAVIIVIVIGILIWGVIPGKIYDVSEILDNPNNFNDKIINVTGLVSEWIFNSKNFTLVDSINNNLSINIKHKGSIPEGFGTNKTIVVTGIFNLENTNIESNSIQIGCPSKY